MPISPTDHEVDLVEADKQLKQSDVEVEEAVEDILNEESDNEDVVPLVDNPPPGSKTIMLDGKPVYKASIVRMINNKVSLSDTLSVSGLITKPKSQDRVRRSASVGRYASRSNTDTSTIDRSFDHPYGIDLPVDADVMKYGDYAALIVTAKTQQMASNKEYRTFMVLVRLISFGDKKGGVQLERTWDVSDMTSFARVEYVHVTHAKDGNGNTSLMVEDKAGVHLSSIPRSSFEPLKPYSHLNVDVEEHSSDVSFMFTKSDLEVGFNTLVAADCFIQLKTTVLTPISMHGLESSFVVKHTILPIVCSICKKVRDLAVHWIVLI